jgi:hypothetical protein
MAFSEQSLAQARQQGYSDDEIFDHIAKSDERFSVAKQQGYSLDDIASHLKQKEGGVNYEDATSQSGQGPLDNRNEQAVSGEVQAGSTEGVQADSMLPAEDQSQFRSDEQARVTTGVPQGGELIEGQTKDAQGGIQGQEEGQGLPSQVSTGNEAQVISPQQADMQAAPFGAEGVQSVPAKSFVEKITEDPKSAIISGVATAAEAGIPLLAGSVAARVLTPLATAAAIETGPAAPFIGAGAGLTAFAGVADITKRIVQKTEEALGISAPIREAQAKQPEVAKAAEIATMAPFLVQSGAGLLKAAATGTVEAAIKGGSLAAGAAKEVGKRLAAGGAAGTIYEAGVRYPVERGIQMIAGGEEPQKPTLESTAESALMMAALSGAGEEVIKNAGLPETARVASEIAPDDAIVKRFEEAPITPEVPPLAPKEAAPSLPKEEVQPPVSVAGEALVVEPTAEAPAEAQPTKPSEAKIEETSGIPTIEGKPVEPETAIKVEEGVAPREGEGEAGQVAPLAEKEEIPRKRIGPGAAGIREFELRDIQQGAEIIKGYKDQNNSVLPYEDWKRNFESTLSYEGKYTEGQLKEFYDQSVSVANEAAKGKPIPEAIQQLDIPIAKTGSTTALTNAKIDEDRVNKGRPKLMGVARKDWGTAWEEAVYQIDQNSSVQDRLITELSKKPRAVNDTEGALLVHRLITKKNEYDNLIDRLEKGGLTSEEQADLRNKIVVLDDQIYGLEALGKSVGTETARGLNFRKAIIANDYSLEGMRTKIRAAKNGEKLTPAEEEKIKQLHDSIKTGEEESERIQNEEKEKFSKEDTRDFIESAKRGSRQRKEKETPDQSLARLKDVAKSRMEDYPKLASTIRKIAISFVDKGITEREPLLDAVHGFLKDEVGMSNSWTKQETSDAICQYGIFRTLSKNATMEAFRRINGQLLELGKRADIVAGEAPKKTGMERAKPDVEARKIARENRKLIKKYNIKTEDPETQLAGALEGIKNKLKNEIEDLSLRIKTGEQAPSKEGSTSDSEIASLKELRSSLKAQFEIMYGKPEKAAPTYDEQVTAAERAYEKLIEKKKEIIANQGVTDLTPAKPEVTSPKIEKQKAEIQELNSELKALRSADSARNEEIKKNQLGQRIEQLKKKIAGEVEEKGGEAYGPESKEVTNLKKEIESLQQTLAEMNPKKSPQEKEIERLQAAIDDVNDRIASGEKVAPTAKKEPLTEYAKKLREDLEMARKQLKEVTRPEPKSEEQKKIDSINRQIEQKKKQLAEKFVLQKKEKYDVASLERSEAVKELQSLRDQIKSEDWYIASRQQAAIDSYVARQNKVANEYLRRIEEQDFAPRQKTERVLNSRELEAQANTEKAKAKFQKELALYNYKNRTKEQKVLDFIVNFSRAMLLSHITTLTKLTAASVEIASLKPLKATAGYAWKLLPPVKEIAKLAPTEGGGKPSEDVRLFVKGIVEGIKDFPQVVKMGQSKIDAMVKEKTQISNSVLEYFGHLHKAMKNPVFTGEFKTSLNRYLNWMEKQGMDIYDPVNQKTAMDAAYKNAQRSIFSEDNSIVNYINTAISVGKRSNNRAVRYSAYALQFGLPIVKIPTNIIKQVFESQLGTGIAAAKITKAMIKGIDTLSPMEADTIMRQLKVGSIGLAMFALGAMRPDMFGGLHLAGITEEDEDLPTGGANILGVKVPKVFFDNPILIAAQVGATVRKYWDAKAGEYGYKGEEAVDFAMAMATAEFELVKETPLLSLPKNIEQTMNIERTPENLGGLIADRIPGPIQDLAKALDTEEDGALPSIKALIGINKDIIKRKPDGSPPERFLQTIQKNLPYFRKQVPEK